MLMVPHAKQQPVLQTLETQNKKVPVRVSHLCKLPYILEILGFEGDQPPQPICFDFRLGRLFSPSRLPSLTLHLKVADHLAQALLQTPDLHVGGNVFVVLLFFFFVCFFRQGTGKCKPSLLSATLRTGDAPIFKSVITWSRIFSKLRTYT
jgi:hypothetical protein